MSTVTESRGRWWEALNTAYSQGNQRRRLRNRSWLVSSMPLFRSMWMGKSAGGVALLVDRYNSAGEKSIKASK